MAAVGEAEERSGGLHLVPVWWPVATAGLAAVFSAGATASTVGWRIVTLEARVTQIEIDRRDALREWTEWRGRVNDRVKGVEDDMGHVRQTVDRIADKLGVIR